MEENQKPKVGVAVMIFKDGKILLGKRKGSHGSGEYALPGGHLEHMESFIDCAIRETREEAGIEIKNVRFQFLANIIEYAPKHYIHIGLLADWDSGEPQIMEPDRWSEPWRWYELDNLPEPLFKAFKITLDCYNKQINYLDIYPVK